MTSKEPEQNISSDNSNYYTDTNEVIDEGGQVERQDGTIPEDAELEELRRVRRALSKMNQGVENVQRQIKYFNSNVSQTTQLLDIWVRILSQTAHNHIFLSSDEWQGGGMDSAKLSDLARRDLERQEEANRRIRETELQRAREEAEAKEREKQRVELAAAAAAPANANRSQGPGEKRQPLHARSGRIQGHHRTQSGSHSRGGSVGVGRIGSSMGGPNARGGRGRGRGSSIPPPTARSRRVQPRR